MSANHRRQPVAFPDAPVGVCKHCGHHCASHRRQHDSCAAQQRAANDYRTVAAEREGTKQRCVDCGYVEGQTRRVPGDYPGGWKWERVTIQRDHPQRIADNGPRDWTVARCQRCHEAKTAEENRGAHLSGTPRAHLSGRTQRRRTSDRRPARRSSMRTVPIGRWVFGAVLIAAAGWWVTHDVGASLTGASDRTGRRGRAEASGVDWGHVERWLVLLAVLVVVVAAQVVWLRVRGARRADKLLGLGDAIARETHTDPSRIQIRVRRWQHGQPVRASCRYSTLFDDADGSRGRDAVEELVARKVGTALVFAWHPARDTVDWRPVTTDEGLTRQFELVAELHPDGKEARQGAIRQRVEESVAAAVRGPVELAWGTFDAIGPLTFTVDYPSSYNDESPETRQQLADRVNNKAPGRWAAAWDTEQNRVRFDRRPPMPKLIEAPVVDADDTWALPFGVDEHAGQVAWSLKTAPHALVVGGTGSGKTVTLRSIVADATARGFTVFCVDPKRIELTGFRDWPGVRCVASSTEEMIALVTMLADEMDDRYAAIEAGDITEDELPPVLVVIDEAREFIDRANAHWKANKTGPGSEHPVIERWRSMARLGRSGRIHLVVGIQRPDARVFGGEARDNYGFRVALGPMSEQGARMVFGRADVGRDVPADAKGRATVGIGEDRALEVQTYYTANPRNPESPGERKHLAALREHAAARAADAVPHINARTVAAYAEALVDGDAPPRRNAKPRALPVGSSSATPKSSRPELVALDDLAEDDRVILDEDGADVEVTVMAPPCPSIDDEDRVELDYRHDDGRVGMVELDSDEKLRRTSTARR